MSKQRFIKKYRLVYFISDFLTPWICQNIEHPLRGELIGLLAKIKQAVYLDNPEGEK